MQETNPSVVQPLAVASTVVRTGSTDSSSNERLHGSASTSTCRFLYIWSCPTQDRQSVTETVSGHILISEVSIGRTAVMGHTWNCVMVEEETLILVT